MGKFHVQMDGEPSCSGAGQEEEECLVLKLGPLASTYRSTNIDALIGTIQCMTHLEF